MYLVTKNSVEPKTESRKRLTQNLLWLDFGSSQD